MTKKDLIKPAALYPLPPKPESISRLENLICENAALAERYEKELTQPVDEVLAGLTPSQKRYYHIRATGNWLAGIQEALELFIGKEPAALFMDQSKRKAERLEKARNLKAGIQSAKKPKKIQSSDT